MLVWTFIPLKDLVQWYTLHVGCLHSGAIILFTAGEKKSESHVVFLGTCILCT